jgi:acetyl-CoA C-acetyltransferase
MPNQGLYIVGAARTPIGAFLGGLSGVPAPRLGALAIKTALERAHVRPDLVDEVFMGNVLSAGVGQAPARQAAIYGGLPNTVPCTTVNKVCGSGLQAAVLAGRSLLLGDAGIAVAGGMESMSNAPYYLTDARRGYRLGDNKVVDGMMYDGLWDPYNEFPMGKAGELCAREYGLGRDAQDAFAAESYRRANAAIASGAFKAEIVPVTLPQKKGEPVVVDTDEEPAAAIRRNSRSSGPRSTPRARSRRATPRASTTAPPRSCSRRKRRRKSTVSSRSRASSAGASPRRRPSGSRRRPPRRSRARSRGSSSRRATSIFGKSTKRSRV